jgi:hypothetical protein
VFETDLSSLFNTWRGSITCYTLSRPHKGTSLRAALHLEAGLVPLEADCMIFQPFLGWRPASTTHHNKIITGAHFPICKGFRAKKLGRFNKSSII